MNNLQNCKYEMKFNLFLFYLFVPSISIHESYLPQQTHQQISINSQGDTTFRISYQCYKVKTKYFKE